MPDTITELCDAIDKLENRSSLCTRIEPALRKQIVEAVINHRPATYREVFSYYSLDRQGISFTAFYYWARKTKRVAATLEMTEAVENKEDSAAILPRILATRLLDTALDEELQPAKLKRLMDTYRMACTIELAKKRLDMQKEALDRSRELDKAAGDNDVLRLARLIARTKTKLDPSAPPTAKS
jgi:hypothetical protein